MVDAGDLDPGASVEDWLARLGRTDGFAALLEPPFDAQLERGYGHTLREIGQQPVTWLETAARVSACRALLDATLEAAGAGRGGGGLVLTGSGSSLHAGECLAPPLQESLRLSVRTAAAGLLLTHPEASLPPAGPYAVVSLARSGNSPESRAVVDSLLARPDPASHLIITCNAQGALATSYASDPRVRTIVLDERTNDRSLVMTSSFTNLVLAGRALDRRAGSEAYLERARVLSRAAAQVLGRDAGSLARTAASGFSSAAYLGSGCRLGSAREASLKMLEMTEGRVWTLSESYLGLRHGPMSAVHEDTLMVAFLSSDPVVRAYEADLIRELDRKKLGARRVVVGAGVPRDLAPGPDDLVVEATPAGASLADEDLVMIDAVVGQLLAFHRCLEEGLRPDSPSEGVISRVVSGFEIHRRA
jgi:tagatose-6-phosphate ketose/aldose isomerase